MAKKNTPSSSDASARFTDTKRVKELIALMADNGLSEIELVEDKARILLRRGGPSHGQAPMHFPGAAPVAHHAPAHVQHPSASAPASAPPVEENMLTIKSPMVGTFYTAANPESDNYVSIGSPVEEKTVVCIIEAMKVFNEIHSEVSGTIAKVLVSNGQAVEFGQPLYLVKPN